MGRVVLRFRFNEIRVSTSIIEELGLPAYFHVYLAKDRLKMYIRACKKDADAYRVNKNTVMDVKTGYSIYSVILMKELFDLMHIEDRMCCVICPHRIVDSKTIEVDLSDYYFVSRRKDET